MLRPAPARLVPKRRIRRMRKYQFGSAERRRVKEVAQIGAFISHLDRHVRIHDYSIAVEQHARVSDRFDAACPILARTYSARGDKSQGHQIHDLKREDSAVHSELLHDKLRPRPCEAHILGDWLPLTPRFNGACPALIRRRLPDHREECWQIYSIAASILAPLGRARFCEDGNSACAWAGKDA